MTSEEQSKAASIIMNHMLSSALSGPSVKNVFVGILRALTKISPVIALDFGESFVDLGKDDRALRTLIQLHG